MLWVIILALALTLVIDRWKREQELRRLEAELERANPDANLQRAAAQSRARSPSRRPP
jgi:hypothetical protein